jgi:hypothetical protein
MQSEFKHKERTTKRNKLNEGDIIAQFKEKMNAIINNNDELKNKINLEYLENCIDNIHYSNPEKSIYLNAVAFILGFYILKNKKINKEKFESLNNLKDLMEDNSISSIDVIRYARYFIINNEFIMDNNIDVNNDDEQQTIKKYYEENVDKKMVTENVDENVGEYYDEDDNTGEYYDEDEENEGVEEYKEGYEPDSLKKFK